MKPQPENPYYLTERSVNDTTDGMPVKGHRTSAGERTRSKILQATVRILGRDGPDRFSASSLAKEAGVSKATLFHHFRAIDEIPILAMESYWIQSLTPRTDAASSARGYLMNLGKQILNLSRRRGTFLKAHVVFLVKAMFDPGLHASLAAGSVQMHRNMQQELAERLPRTLSRREIEDAARMVEMMLDGLLLGIAAVDNLQALASARRAWTRFVNLLLKELE